MYTIPFFFVFFVAIYNVICEEGCDVCRVQHGDIVREELIPIVNSSGHQIATKAIYFPVDTSSSEDNGSSLYVRCKNPYRFQGDRMRVLAEIICTNGKWVPFPVCLLPPCDKRTLNYRGLDKGGEKTFFHGESFEPKCQHGYRIAEKADKTIHCENGQWKGNLPPCTKEVQCKLPEKPDFGSVELVGDSAVVGSLIVFACDAGRKLVGSVVSKCNDAGEWTLPVPKCVVPCKTESLLDFEGLLVENRRTLDDGEWFQPRCDKGYEIANKNDSEIYCRDGQWEGNLPPCSPVEKTTCETEALSVFEGLLLGNRLFPLEDGEWFEPKCDKGFEVVDNNDQKIYCRGGKWEGNLTPCVPAEKEFQCGIPAKPDFGAMKLIGNNRAVGSVVYFSCDKGRKLKGSPIAMCDKDGEWSSPIPECIAVCETHDLLDFEGILLEGRRTFDEGEWFQPRCDEGFDITDKNDSKIYCREGEWRGNIPPCSPVIEQSTEIQLTTTVSPEEVEDHLTTLHPRYIKISDADPSSAINITTLVGQTVYLHCVVDHLGDGTVYWFRLRDFQLLTASTRTYTTGNRFQPIHIRDSNVWTLQIQYPNVADEGLYECQVRSSPPKNEYFRLTVVVPHTHILEGQDMHVEVGSSISLTCVIMGSPIAPVFVFWFQDDDSLIYESSRASITLQKDENAIISNLLIKGAQPHDSGNYSCVPSNAASVSTIVHVGKESCTTELLAVFTGLVLPEKRSFNDGEWIEPTCDTGFQVADKNDSKLFCRNGQWFGYLPPCASIICRLPSVPNGDLGRYEEIYRRYRWKTVFTKVSEGTTLSEEESVVLKCHKDYVPKGRQDEEMSISCLNGELSPEPKCVTKPVPCDVSFVLGFSGLVLSAPDTVNDGEWIEPMCADGYEYLDKNDPKLYCRQGRWEGTFPPCYPAPCLSNPPVPENGRIKPTWEAVEHGATVEYECLRNSEMAEKGSVSCNFGKWTGSLPICRDRRCYLRNLPNKEGINLSDDDEPVLPFRKADITCMDGYSLMYPEVRCVNGIWQTQNSLSPCQESKCEVTSIVNGETLRETTAQDTNLWGATNDTSIVYELVDIGSFISSGTSLYVSCLEPYKFRGEEEELNVITCRKGTWTPSPECIRVSTCETDDLYESIPSDVFPYADEGTTVLRGFVVKLGCMKFGMVFSGTSSAVCNADGTWHVEPNIRCTHGCNKWEKSPVSEVIILPDKSFYSFGESVTFSCPAGKSLTTETERILCLKYGWEPNNIPDCR